MKKLPHSSYVADTDLSPATENPGSAARLASLWACQRRSLETMEPEDASLTGMTRSLNRRVLALNLAPMPPISATARNQALRVA